MHNLVLYSGRTSRYENQDNNCGLGQVSPKKGLWAAVLLFYFILFYFILETRVYLVLDMTIVLFVRPGIKYLCSPFL